MRIELIREIGYENLQWDCREIRHDLRVRDEVISVYSKIGHDAPDSEIALVRAAVKESLEAFIKDNNLSEDDIVPLDTPPDYLKPKWLQ